MLKELVDSKQFLSWFKDAILKDVWDFNVNIGQIFPFQVVIHTWRKREKYDHISYHSKDTPQKKKGHGKAKAFQNTQLEGKCIAENFAPAC